MYNINKTTPTDHGHTPRKTGNTRKNTPRNTKDLTIT